MSIRSLTDFMEVSLRSERRLGCTATVTGRRGPQVDTSVRGADFWWPKLRTFGGHQCGPLMAISADFLVAMDKQLLRHPDAALPAQGPLPQHGLGSLRRRARRWTPVDKCGQVWVGWSFRRSLTGGCHGGCNRISRHTPPGLVETPLLKLWS